MKVDMLNAESKFDTFCALILSLLLKFDRRAKGKPGNVQKQRRAL